MNDIHNFLVLVWRTDIVHHDMTSADAYDNSGNITMNILSSQPTPDVSSWMEGTMTTKNLEAGDRSSFFDELIVESYNTKLMSIDYNDCGDPNIYMQDSVERSKNTNSRMRKSILEIEFVPSEEQIFISSQQTQLSNICPSTILDDDRGDENNIFPVSSVRSDLIATVTENDTISVLDSLLDHIINDCELEKVQKQLPDYSPCRRLNTHNNEIPLQVVQYTKQTRLQHNIENKFTVHRIIQRQDLFGEEGSIEQTVGITDYSQGDLRPMDLSGRVHGRPLQAPPNLYCS